MRKLVLLRIFSRERVFGILRHLCHLNLPHCGHGEVECDVEAGGRKWIERVTGCGHGGQLHGQKRCLLVLYIQSIHTIGYFCIRQYL
jgi:hypothetical protein